MPFCFLAKHADTVPGNVIPAMQDIETCFGLWILVITILAAWSRSPEAALQSVSPSGI